MEGAGDTLYAVYRLIRVSECTGIQSIFDWTDNWLLLNDNKMIIKGNKKNEEFLLLLQIR